MCHEQVAGEERDDDGPRHCAGDLVAALDGVEGQVGLVAGALEVGVGEVLGLGVGLCDGPSGRCNAAAPEVTGCGFGCSYALWLVGVKRHGWVRQLRQFRANSSYGPGDCCAILNAGLPA
jgi:hypothetical protein